MPSRSFKVFRGMSGFYRIASEWKKLTDGLPRKRYFHLFEWYQSYFEALEQDIDSVFFFLAYQHDEIEAIFPLRRRHTRRFGITATILEVPDHPHLLLQDFVIGPAKNHAGLINDLLCFTRAHKEYSSDIIQAAGILEDAGIRTVATEQSDVFSVWEESAGCDYLSVVPFEQCSHRLSKSFKAQLRKANNRASKGGGVTYSATRDPAKLEKYYQRFLDVEASGWKGIQGTAIKRDEALVAFYSNLAKYFSTFGGSEIHLLEIQGETLAAEFSLVVGDTMYCLKIGYDERWASLSPGHLLFQHVIDNCAQTHAVTYINLVTDAAWHRSWQPNRLRVYRWRRFNATLPGLAAFLLHLMKRSVAVFR